MLQHLHFSPLAERLLPREMLLAMMKGARSTMPLPMYLYRRVDAHTELWKDNVDRRHRIGDHAALVVVRRFLDGAGVEADRCCWCWIVVCSEHSYLLVVADPFRLRSLLFHQKTKSAFSKNGKESKVFFEIV